MSNAGHLTKVIAFLMICISGAPTLRLCSEPALSLSKGQAAGKSSEWPCWRGPNHDGKSPDTDLLKEWPEGGPALLWQADSLGEGFSTVAISGGFIYTTGDVLWSNDWCKNNVANCPDPAYVDGYVFWANGYNKGGICLKLNTSNGKVSVERVWTTKNMVCHHGGYIVHEGYLYGNHNGGWSCLDFKTGQLKWHEKAVGKGSLCFADGMLYLFGENSGQAALATCSPDGMEIKGRIQVQGSGPSWAHPVVIGGRLYLRYADNLYCFDVKAKES